jgi:hypothetical protein
MDGVVSDCTSLHALDPLHDLTASRQLAVFPWIASLPFVITTLVIGLRNHTTIVRTSAAYCIFTYPAVYVSFIFSILPR